MSPDWVIDFLGRTPRRRLIVGLLAGVLVGSGFPPWNLIVLGPIGLGLIYLVLGRTTTGESPRIGAVFGVGFYGAHIYWFASFHVLALPAALALAGIWFAGWAWFCRGLRLGAFGYAVVWMGVEAGLTIGFTAFPWSRLADWTLLSQALAQPISLVGEVGWGGVVALSGFGLGAALDSRRRTYVPLVLAVVLLLAGGFWGWERLDESRLETYDRSVALVQPNVESTFSQTGVPMELFLQSARLTAEKTRQGDLVLWPESVVGEPVVDLQGPRWALRYIRTPAVKKLRQLSRRKERDLVFGAVFVDRQPDRLNRLNGAVWVNSTGEPAGIYGKRIPVPFGEYVPYMGQVDWVTSLARRLGVLGYRPSSVGGSFDLSLGEGATEVAVLVCYEDAFSGFVRQQADHGAELFVSMANDSWSRSVGAHQQHFNRAIVRALETGRTVLRVGNTGISGIVDPFGRVEERLEAYERGVIRGTPYRPLAQEPLHSRWGHWGGYLVAFLLTLLGSFERIRSNEFNDFTE